MSRRPPARESAFGATPGRVPDQVAGAHERWLTAVVLGGLGHYAAAAAAVERLIADPKTPPAVLAHAAITRASHLRQLGGHAAARVFDAQGLRWATAALDGFRPDRSRITPSGPVRADARTPGAGSPRPVACNDPDGGPDDGFDAAAARIDALVGLAADAVGLGDPATAQRLLDVAEPALAAHASWRPRVRAAWVLAEVLLVRGRAERATAPAAAALAAARRAGSVRHVLKSRLVLAVTRGAAGEPAAEIITELDAVAERCRRTGLLPLCRPAALAAADLWDGFNERTAPVPDASPTDVSSGATRRRHAADVTLNVLEQRSDPLSKRQMGESVWIQRPVTLL